MAYITSRNGSRQPMFLATMSIFLLLSTIAVSLRLWCRLNYIHHVGLDDHFMFAALVVAISMGIMNGFHFRFAVYFVAAFVAIYTIIVFFVNAFECRDHPSHAWASDFPQGCNNLPATYFSTASINILTDVMILLLPIRSFSHLNLPRNKKWALLGIFMVGGIAVIASIIRLYALWVYTVTTDVSYDAIYILLLSQIEVNMAIISASAPALQPLFNKVFLSASYNR
ncbi:hypothetical protein K504DRAFT_334252, partial [Pleomassaria siparia CBS 279.74]